MSKSHSTSYCKSKFMSLNNFFLFSQVWGMQLAVKQFPSTVIILSISLLFNSFNEWNILYVRVYLILMVSRKNPTKKWIKKHLLDGLDRYHSGGYPVAWSLLLFRYTHGSKKGNNIVQYEIPQKLMTMFFRKKYLHSVSFFGAFP